MIYGGYEVVNQPQPQMAPPQPQIIIQQQQGPSQPQMQQGPQPLLPQMDVEPAPRDTAPSNDVLEIAEDVLDLTTQVLELHERGSPTWASLERGDTPTSPYTDDEVRI